jgi:hypothetical protein
VTAVDLAVEAVAGAMAATVRPALCAALGDSSPGVRGAALAHWHAVLPTGTAAGRLQVGMAFRVIRQRSTQRDHLVSVGHTKRGSGRWVG